MIRYLILALALVGAMSVATVASFANNGEENGLTHTNCGEDSTIAQGDEC